MQVNQDLLSLTRNLGRKGCGRLFTDRDSKILHFLWKWKLASTATVHEAVGRPLTPYSTYKALERLARYKFITTAEAVEQNFKAWILTDRGFSAIRPSLGELCEEGFGSEHLWHDRNVIALQLGEWATHQLPIVTHFTEQEMRRRSVENYPDWLPASKLHRPDGYTRIRSESKNWLLAFEAEIWPKALATYESTLRFYQMMKQIDRVYWLIGDPLVKVQILRARTCVRENTQNFHFFIDMEDYISAGWNAPVTNECSDNVGTFRENMQAICGDTYGKHVGQTWGQSSVTVHYDTRKVLGKKRT